MPGVDTLLMNCNMLGRKEQNVWLKLYVSPPLINNHLFYAHDSWKKKLSLGKLCEYILKLFRLCFSSGKLNYNHTLKNIINIMLFRNKNLINFLCVNEEENSLPVFIFL